MVIKLGFSNVNSGVSDDSDCGLAEATTTAISAMTTGESLIVAEPRAMLTEDQMTSRSTYLINLPFKVRQNLRRQIKLNTVVNCFISFLWRSKNISRNLLI